MMDCATRQGRKRRRGYQYHEDMAILNYIAENNVYMFIHGNECWNAMAIKEVTPHSAHSMRTHFLKLMVKKLDVYDIPDEVKAKIRAYTNMSYSNKPSSDESDSSGSVLINPSSQRNKNSSLGLRVLNSSITSVIQPNNASKSPILKLNTNNILHNSSKINNSKISHKSRNKLSKNKLIYFDESSHSPNTQMEQQVPRNLQNDDIMQTSGQTLNHKTNQKILNELKNLHKNITELPFVSSTPNSVLNSLEFSQGSFEKNSITDQTKNYQFVHNAHTLLQPLNEAPYFINPSSPTPSSQFYTPTLQFQDGALVNPELATNNIDASEVENSSCNTLCGVDIFPALHTPPKNNTSSRPYSSTSSRRGKTDGIASQNTIPSQSSSRKTPLRLPHTNVVKFDKISSLQELCKSSSITPKDMYIFLRRRGWLKEILKCALSSNDFG